MKKNKFIIRLILATIIRKIRVFFLKLKEYNLYYSTIVEGGVYLDKLHAKGFFISRNTLIARNSSVYIHDHCKRVGDNQPLLIETKIGDNCSIAVGYTILPATTIWDQVILGAGSVVTKNVPSNCVVAGNPAKIIRRDIKMNDFAALENWDEKNGWF